jgi:hypothetical protein
MKKPSSKIRDEIAKLQERLKVAETKEAERLGRLALKAGLGDIEIEDGELQAAFEDLAKWFRGGKVGSNGRKQAGSASAETPPITPGAAQGVSSET